MKNMPEQTVLIDKPKEKILRFTLNRPEKRNALNDEIRKELFDGLRQGDRDKETSVMIFVAQEKHFLLDTIYLNPTTLLNDQSLKQMAGGLGMS